MPKMNIMFTIFTTWTTFAIWQSTLILGIGVVLTPFFRGTPWKIHSILTWSVYAAIFAPTLSTWIRTQNRGLLPFGFPWYVIPSESLGLLLLCGAVPVALMLVFGIVHGRRLMFRARPFPDRSSQESLLKNAKILRHVSLPILFTSDEVRSPTVWSWGLHPAVLLPESLSENLSEPERDAIFQHELAHIVRRDHLAAFWTRICGCFLFWNPLYWFALGKSDAAADQSCDLLVLSQGTVSAEQYAETLLRLAAENKPNTFLRPSFQFLSRKEKIMKRIHTIMEFDPRTGRPAQSRLWTLSVCCATFFVSVLLAFCQENYSQAQQTGEEHFKWLLSPSWLLDQEAQERPTYYSLYNGDGGNWLSARIIFRTENESILGLSPEQDQRLFFLRKENEIGKEIAQKRFQNPTSEMLQIEQNMRDAIPKDDPDFRNATEEQKRAYVAAAEKFYNAFFYEAIDDEVAETLTPEQMQKVNLLKLQLLPEIGFPSVTMFESLGLSDEQKAEMEAIKEEMRPEFDALVDEEMNMRREFFVAMIENIKEMNKSHPFQSPEEAIGKMSEAGDKARETNRDKWTQQRKANAEKGQKFATRFKARLMNVLTDEQLDKMQKLMDEAPDFVKKMLRNMRQERIENERNGVYRPGPDSWRPGDGTPEEFKIERKKFPSKSTMTNEKSVNAAQAEPDDRIEIPLDPFACMVAADNDAAGYMVNAKINLACNKDDETKFNPLFEKAKGEVREQILKILRSSNAHDLNDPNVTAIKKRIHQKINETLGESLVKAVVLESFNAASM